MYVPNFILEYLNIDGLICLLASFIVFLIFLAFSPGAPFFFFTSPFPHTYRLLSS